VALHQKIIKKYYSVFIPDLPGDLKLIRQASHKHKLPGNIRFIGILSRFINSDSRHNETPEKSDHTTVFFPDLSPQREISDKNL